MKLSQKLVALILILVALPIAGIGLYAIYMSVDNNRHQFNNRLNNQAEQQAFTLKHYFADTHSVLELLSKNSSLFEYIKRSEDEQRYALLLPQVLDNFAQYIQSYPKIIEIQLVRADGLIDARLAADFSPMNDQWLTNRPWFKKLKPNVEFQFIFDNRQSLFPNLYAIRSLKQADASHWGYLLIQVNPETIHNVIHNTVGDNGLNILTDHNGEILVASFNYPSKQLPKYLHNQLQNNASKLLQTYFNDQDLIIAKKSIRDEFILATAVPSNELAITKHISYVMLYTIIISMLLTSWLAFFALEKLILKPIAQLNAASKSIASGKLAMRLPNNRKDEMGRLFESFNRMVNSIKQARNSIEDYKDHLEEKVESRTLALQSANEELTQARIIAEQASELKSRFLANMSHEIRTPLTAICGFTEQALLHQNNGQLREELLQKVLSSSNHLMSLLSDILDLSKIESGKLEVESIAIDLSQMVTELANIGEKLCQQKSIRFDVRLAPALPATFNSDPTRLKQILMNLISNAAKFTNQGSVEFAIDYNPLSQNLSFSIQDTGIGLSDSVQQKLFKPFIQADSSTTRNYGGTGLGLAVSQSLAECLAGKITVKSQEGQGSIFTLTLDLSEQTVNNLTNIELVPQTNNKAKPKLDFSSARILLAEDNTDNQRLIQLILEPTNIKIDIANNGQEALEKSLVHDYDLILMDMQMPIMGGLEATQLIRQTGFEQPILAVTANVMREEITHYLQQGCNGHIAKPIDSAALLEILAKYLLDQARDSESIDFDQIAATLKNSQGVQQLADEFTSKLPSQLTELQSAAGNQDFQKLALIAHTLKGNSASFGNHQLTMPAAQLEQAANSCNMNLVEEKLAIIKLLIEKPNFKEA
ncbi:sensory transduction histidine kinase [Catenovulum agarivorans DS-2]|uniref:histidine kinase n=1 Tax=Catenovulum agarivorans DS-2 TaxID=1328313 RepID=W7QGI1_9ALTE|nr:hybrid sensor histidine kinase/response regulator [Catenovulum agarivorans]EWH11021.1 sensory transduction histidine kinase [Catenovulum agarivorans DS-2]